MLLFSTHRPQLLTAGRLSVGAGYGTIIVSIPWIEVRNIKIVIITGSAHRHGTTATLTDHFQRGVESAGHEVFRFDAAFKNVHPCIGCDKCNRTGECTFVADDMKELTPHLLEADAVVFVSPIYYFDINAQLKSVIDRFYANNPALMGKKKTVLITAMADPDKKDRLGGEHDVRPHDELPRLGGRGQAELRRLLYGRRSSRRGPDRRLRAR